MSPNTSRTLHHQHPQLQHSSSARDTLAVAANQHDDAEAHDRNKSDAALRAQEAQRLLHGYDDDEDDSDNEDGIAMTELDMARPATSVSAETGKAGGLTSALQVQESGASRRELLDDEVEELGAASVVYRTYRRRWFGLVQLILLNLVISWDWLTFAAVSTTSAEYFGVSENAINWLSNACLFAFCVAAPAVLMTLHRGPKPAIMVASVFMLVGNWVRYAGARKANFGVLMFGQIIIGLAQPFVLTAPTTYSDLWFTERGRTLATALPSLANPLGGALAQLLSPVWVSKKPAMIPNMVLYVAIISSVAFVPSFFLTARPPTPVAASSTVGKPAIMPALLQLRKNVSFWLVFIPFGVFAGFFNATSSLINQIYYPYAYTEDQAGIGGAILIVVGIIGAIISSLIIDRTHAYQLIIKMLVPLAALSYLALTFTPATRTLPGPYIILALLGISSFSLLPVALEYTVELTFPVSPDVSSVVMWFLAQLLGALFTIIMASLKDEKGSTPPDGDRPPGNMYRSLTFQAVLCCVVAVLPLMLGWKRIGLGKEDRKRMAADGQGSTSVTLEA